MPIYEQSPLDAVKTLLSFIGVDPERSGLTRTPARVLKAWRETWGKGYHEPPPRMTLFKEEGVNYDQMVIVRDIQFYSTCEHHLAPFFGTADIAYIPTEAGIVGLSKLARAVDHFARRLQVQERLNGEIADFLVMHVSPNVAVRMRATHFCMVSRGVSQPNSVTQTTALRGTFYDEPSCRAEFFSGIV